MVLGEEESVLIREVISVVEKYTNMVLEGEESIREVSLF